MRSVHVDSEDITPTGSVPKSRDDRSYIVIAHVDIFVFRLSAGKEIKRWYKKYCEDSNFDGPMTKHEFVIMYQKLFPKGNAEEFCDKVNCRHICTQTTQIY